MISNDSNPDSFISLNNIIELYKNIETGDLNSEIQLSSDELKQIQRDVDVLATNIFNRGTGMKNIDSLNAKLKAGVKWSQLKEPLNNVIVQCSEVATKRVLQSDDLLGLILEFAVSSPKEYAKLASLNKDSHRIANQEHVIRAMLNGDLLSELTKEKFFELVEKTKGLRKIHTNDLIFKEPIEEDLKDDEQQYLMERRILEKNDYKNDFTTEDLIRLIKLSPELKILEGGLEIDEVSALTESCKQLRDLRIYKSMDLSDECLGALISANPHLETVCLIHAFQVGNYTMESLSKCSELKILELNSHHISDNHVELIATNCPKLKEMSFLSCIKLTDESLEYLQKCNHLQQLEIFNCLNISQKGLDALKKTNPKLNYLLRFY